MTEGTGAAIRGWTLEGELRGRGYTGEVGLLVTDLAGDVIYSHQARRPFPAASTIKVPLLLLALERAQAGRLALDSRVVMQPEDRVPGAGVLHELAGGLALTWQDVLTLMIVVSDNTATNLLIEELGLEAVNDWLAAQGLTETRLVGKLQLPPQQQNEAQHRGERNRTCARDQATLLGRLVRGELLDQHHSELARHILGRQQLRDLIGRSVPPQASGQPTFQSLSKSGELSGVHHDVGILYSPRPLIVALLSEGGTDPREHPQNRDVTLLAQVLWPLLAQAGQVYGKL